MCDVTTNSRLKLLAAARYHVDEEPADRSSVGLTLTDEETMLLVAQRLGVRICTHHLCVYREMIDAIGLSVQSGGKSAQRYQSHTVLNELI